MQLLVKSVERLLCLLWPKRAPVCKQCLRDWLSRRLAAFSLSVYCCRFKLLAGSNCKLRFVSFYRRSGRVSKVMGSQVEVVNSAQWKVSNLLINSAFLSNAFLLFTFDVDANRRCLPNNNNVAIVVAAVVCLLANKTLHPLSKWSQEILVVMHF